MLPVAHVYNEHRFYCLNQNLNKSSAFPLRISAAAGEVLLPLFFLKHILRNGNIKKREGDPGVSPKASYLLPRLQCGTARGRRCRCRCRCSAGCPFRTATRVGKRARAPGQQRETWEGAFAGARCATGMAPEDGAIFPLANTMSVSIFLMKKARVTHGKASEEGLAAGRPRQLAHGDLK